MSSSDVSRGLLFGGNVGMVEAMVSRWGLVQKMLLLNADAWPFLEKGSSREEDVLCSCDVVTLTVGEPRFSLDLP